MATRNVISISKKHRSKSDRERREYEESLLNSDGLDLENIPATEFVNETAKKEYDRILHRLREEVGVVGNLNKSDLLTYANGYGKYMDCVRQYRKKDFQLVIETKSGPKANPVLRMMDEAQRCMGEAARRLGMTVDGQLKTAKAKADKEEAEMEKVFGAI
jgi:P27 family predicted phage terminase small subunit